MSDGHAFVARETVFFTGVLKLEMIFDVLAHIRTIVNEARYPSIILDFTKIEAAYGSFLTILLARLKFLQMNRIDVKVIPPVNAQARNFMDKLNWITLVSAAGHERSRFRPDKMLPIFQYIDADEQGHVVGCVMRGLLQQIPGLERIQLRSAQWALDEITDNVLNHAESLVGGFVYCQIHHNLKLIEFVIADAGIGIAKSLREQDHGLALEKAISEGVTKNTETNQGNGLYGTWRLATLSDGIFVIHSYRGRLFVRRGGSVKLDNKVSVYPGTYVVFQIDYSNPDLIAKALTFKGKTHEPSYDYIEQHFESDGEPHTIIKLADHVVSTGSRESGRKIATLIDNVIRMAEDNRVDIDFDGIIMVSSSFADECFGRLIARMGPAEFFSRITFVNADAAIRAIIDRSVLQRLRIAPIAETDT